LRLRFAKAKGEGQVRRASDLAGPRSNHETRPGEVGEADAAVLQTKCTAPDASVQGPAGRDVPGGLGPEQGAPLRTVREDAAARAFHFLRRPVYPRRARRASEAKVGRRRQRQHFSAGEARLLPGQQRHTPARHGRGRQQARVLCRHAGRRALGLAPRQAVRAPLPAWTGRAPPRVAVVGVPVVHRVEGAGEARQRGGAHDDRGEGDGVVREEEGQAEEEGGERRGAEEGGEADEGRGRRGLQREAEEEGEGSQSSELQEEEEDGQVMT
ncbi:hypothetical protein THAOC_13479, partial [Thalassiosira oceanica]